MAQVTKIRSSWVRSARSCPLSWAGDQLAAVSYRRGLAASRAGVIGQVGSGVTGYAAGDRVFGAVPGMSPAVHDGAWAELIAVLAQSVAHLPAGVDLAQAGATVIAPGLAEDRDYCSLGVAEVLDRNGDIPAQVRERHPDLVDALLDLTSQSPDRLNTYAAVVRDGGPIGSSLGAAGEGSGRANVSAVPTADQLDHLAGLLADGTLTVPIQASYPIAQADHALKALTGQHSQGKLAITPNPATSRPGPPTAGPFAPSQAPSRPPPAAASPRARASARSAAASSAPLPASSTGSWSAPPPTRPAVDANWLHQQPARTPAAPRPEEGS